MTHFSPREIVSELDRYIVGQNDAKRAVAIALRNRWRRKQLPEDLREEVTPKNILMIGPTGVGKTEIARRLAKLAGAPFLKVEATKFTEVGYVGRDVEQIIRDLVEVSLNLVRERRRREVRAGLGSMERSFEVVGVHDGRPLPTDLPAEHARGPGVGLPGFGRLAQWLEHSLHTRGVTGSNPVSPTEGPARTRQVWHPEPVLVGHGEGES